MRIIIWSTTKFMLEQSTLTIVPSYYSQKNTLMYPACSSLSDPYICWLLECWLLEFCTPTNYSPVVNVALDLQYKRGVLRWLSCSNFEDGAGVPLRAGTMHACFLHDDGFVVQRRCGMQQRTEQEQRTENGDVHFLFAFQRIGHPNGAKLQGGHWDSASASGWKGEVKQLFVLIG